MYTLFLQGKSGYVPKFSDILPIIMLINYNVDKVTLTISPKYLAYTDNKEDILYNFKASLFNPFPQIKAYKGSTQKELIAYMKGNLIRKHYKIYSPDGSLKASIHYPFYRSFQRVVFTIGDKIYKTKKSFFESRIVLRDDNDQEFLSYNIFEDSDSNQSIYFHESLPVEIALLVAISID
ncbi:hypothetical protein [Spirochaeta cellobiosiphila]|uniref:hypothetical protein n=1 Tax=Spirochaeta cellobiosiphila TaxID=504483 RepID=UPI00146DF22E|nr:hypothetical protein [Spirochaeta cellobiosiphila]